MDIGFFVNFDNQVIQLPVNPEKVSVTFKGNNASKELISLGEINLLRDRKLADISFKSFFPQYEWFPAIRTLGKFKTPDFYKKFFQTVMESKKPCRLIVTGIGINMKCSVEEFEYYHQGGDHEDAYYSLEFKEYRDHYIAEIPIDTSLGSTNNSSGSTSNKPTTDAPAKPVSPAEITIGCTVILNGRVHYDSYGSKPGKTFKNYRGKINFINKKGTHPYHVTTPDGGWLGWVTKESVVLA